MSLLRVRRDRKKNWIDTKKTRSPVRMIVLLAGIALAAWYITTTFQ